MKKVPFLYVLFFSALAYVTLQSGSGGAAANGLGDMTGSPFSSGTCGNCHSGGNFATTFNVQLLDASSNVVTSYQPGQSYTLRFVVGGSASRFGFQAVAALVNGNNAGSMASPSANAQVRTVSSRSYAEHNNPSASGTFSVQWTAPAAGSGNVNVWGIGLGTNNNNNQNGDQVSSGNGSVFTISEDATAINYSAAGFLCSGDNRMVSPTRTGEPNGVYSASPSIQTLGALTGDFNLLSTPAGTYTITYTYQVGGSTRTTSTVINVNPQDQATVQYSSSSYCAGSANVLPTITGTQGGTFSVTTAGLSVNPTTGQLDLRNAQAGNYLVRYTTNGPCPTVVNIPMNVTARSNAGFNYGASSFCLGTGSVTPTTQGTGTFSFTPTGLVLLSTTTGEIDLVNTQPGTYTIRHIVSGVCADTQTVNLTLTNNPDPRFIYPNSGTLCLNSGHVGSVILGTPGGSFSARPNGITFADGQGTINTDASAAGTYWVRYSFGGSCAASDSVQVRIEQDSASLTYPDAMGMPAATFCQYDNQPIQPTVTGNNTSGTYRILPNGTINANLGSFTPSDVLTQHGAGNYTVQFITDGVCPDTVNYDFTLTFCTSSERLASTPLAVYPNPSKGHVFVDLGSAPASELSLYNSLGQLVWQTQTQQSGVQQFEWPKQLSAGLYHLHIKQNAQAQILNIILE